MDPRPGYTYQAAPPSPLPSPHHALPTRPSPRADSLSRPADRKRRLTQPDSPTRRPSSIRMHSGAGASSADPIVLTASPAALRPLPPLPPQAFHEHPGRSHVVVPPWQPDADVHQCPVCGRPFTFLQRRHHCRKCGRVVCQACSPHRITIPRQFIVHPPSDHPSNTIDLTGDDDDEVNENDNDNDASPFGSFRNPALGGGEEVRVCNPCVPDPNPNPLPHYIPPYLSHYNAPSSSRPSRGPPPPPPHTRAPISAQNIHHTPSRTTSHGQAQREHNIIRNVSDAHRRVSYHGATSSTVERRLPPLPGSSSAYAHPSRSYHQDASLSRLLTSATSRDAYVPPYFSSTSLAAAHNLNRSMNTPTPHPFLPQQSQPTRPRRQVAEEDECPICGHELPPHGPGNDDSDRTQHIQECIALYSASPAPVPLTPQTSASLPIQRTRGMSTAGGAGSGPGLSNASRSSHAARGMVPYTATEKDCTDDDGREAECIICLEDFETGDKMARLVCWCKFHEVC